MKDPVQQFDTELRNRLSEKGFVCSDETRAFLKAAAVFILQYLPFAALGCNLQDYESIIAFESGESANVDLFAASVIINGFHKLRPVDVGVYYTKHLQECNRASEQWNEQVVPMKTSLMREIETKNRLGIKMPMAVKK